MRSALLWTSHQFSPSSIIPCIKGVPAAAPQDVAREIVASCRHGRPEVTMPKGLGLIGAVEQGLPEGLGEFIKRAVGAKKRIAPGNEQAKAYQDRTAR